MRHLAFALLVLTACSSVRVRYLGNGEYSAAAGGSAYHSVDAIEDKARKEMFRTCRDKHGMGFRVLAESSDLITTGASSRCTEWGCSSDLIRKPTASLRFICEGEIDPGLESQYADD